LAGPGYLPPDLAAQPVSVLVQDPETFTEPWCQCSILRNIRPISSLIELMPRYVIEITLPDIEYLKSVEVVESDELKVICLPSFTTWSADCQNSSDPSKPGVCVSP
jgi:hypothetical protein